MAHIQTYEGMLNRFFKNDYVKRITNGVLSLLKLGEKGSNSLDTHALSMIYDFIYHKYIDNNTCLFYTVMSQSGDIRDSILKITFEHQWIIIDFGNEQYISGGNNLSQYLKLKEFQYFIHLLKIYGEKTQNTIKTSNGIEEYFLTLENADKLINELTPEGIADYNEIGKYNL